MNKRQKKKQFKKIHGYNPPSRKKIITEQVALDKTEIVQMNYEQKFNDCCITEQQIQRIAELLQKEVAAVFKGIGEIAKGISEVFLGAAEYFSQTQQEDNPVVLTKALAERRKQGCRTRKYKVYKK